MIYNDVIHVQAKEGGEDDNVKALTPWKLMTIYVQCMMYGDVLNLQLG